MPDTPPDWLLRLVRASPAQARVPGPLWPALLRLANATEMQGLLAHEAFRQRVELTEAVRELFSAALRNLRRHHAFHFVEASRACAALAARDIPVVAIKGVCLARTLYPEATQRSFRDIDLLVVPEDVERALGALAELGYEQAMSPALREAYRRHHFHAILSAPGAPYVELHWSLARPDDPFGLDPAALLEDRVPAAAADDLPRPHPDTHVLVAAISLLRDGFTSFKPLVDLDRLLRRERGLRWDRVAALAERGGLAPTLRVALELAHGLLETPVEEALAVLPRLGRARRPLGTLRLAELALDPRGPQGLRRSRLAQLWLSPRPRQTLRNFVWRPRFERAATRALGLPRRQVWAAGIRRGADLAAMAGWQAWRLVRQHRRAPLTPGA